MTKNTQRELVPFKLDPTTKARIDDIRDIGVLKRLEREAAMAKARPSVEAQKGLQEAVRTRLGLYELSERVPNDVLREVDPTLSQEKLRSMAAGADIDKSLAAMLLTSLPPERFKKDLPAIIHPNTPTDTPVPPIGMLPVHITNPPTLDKDKQRKDVDFWRRGFGAVGALADTRQTPPLIVCSGLVLEGKWFLTATHCLLDSTIQGAASTKDLAVFLPFQGGTAKIVDRQGRTSIDMFGVALRPTINWLGQESGKQLPTSEDGFKAEVGDGNDITLLELDIPGGKLPQAVHASRIANTAEIKVPITVAGYGRTTAVDLVNNLGLEIGWRMTIADLDDPINLVIGDDRKRAADGRVCFGDSGGPVFLGSLLGVETPPFVVAAMASAVDPDTGNDCSVGVQLYARLDRPEVRQWLCKKAKVGC
ncbi:trypsin-like serine peptidase [Cupriavidus pauculus]|nr:trypsin-like serine protease [Cupriavidus pauculus]